MEKRWKRDGKKMSKDYKKDRERNRENNFIRDGDGERECRLTMNFIPMLLFGSCIISIILTPIK